MLLGFFDESEGDSSTDPLGVAGYVFKPDDYKRFGRAWKRVKAAAGDPPALHMTDLWAGGRAFRGLNRAKRAAVFAEAVDAINEHMMAGAAVIFPRRQFEAFAPPDWPQRMGSIYSAACQMVLQGVGFWMIEHNYVAPVRYIFEEGHPRQPEADRLLGSFAHDPGERAARRYHSHAFGAKTQFAGLQAADVLAWIVTKVTGCRPGKPSNDSRLSPLVATTRRARTQVPPNGLQGGQACEPVGPPSSRRAPRSLRRAQETDVPVKSREDSLSALKLFVEKVDYLRSLSFCATLAQVNRLQIKVNAVTGVDEYSLQGPDTEQIDSFLNTLRMFVQKRDPIALHRIPGHLRAIEASPKVLEHFLKWQGYLDGFLDGTYCFFHIDGDSQTRCQLFEAVAYGERSHVTPGRRAEIVKWRETPIGSVSVGFEFNIVLATYMETLAPMAALCRTALAELKRPT